MQLDVRVSCHDADQGTDEGLDVEKKVLRSEFLNSFAFVRLHVQDGILN